jgi:uncharacterized membrane protein YccF (DUF307 family)
MRVIGNILWLLLGGLWLALGYAAAGLIAFVFIITIPFGIQAFKLASFTLWPFGRMMVPRAGASPGLSAVANIIWLLAAGIWLALGHLLAAVVNALTVIGLPFAIAHLKLAGASLAPFGQTIVSIDQTTRRPPPGAISVEPLGG